MLISSESCIRRNEKNNIVPQKNPTAMLYFRIHVKKIKAGEDRAIVWDKGLYLI